MSDKINNAQRGLKEDVETMLSWEGEDLLKMGKVFKLGLEQLIAMGVYSESEKLSIKERLIDVGAKVLAESISFCFHTEEEARLIEEAHDGN